jgi:hypothetical protein
MKICKIEKDSFDSLKQNQICKDDDIQASCIHNDLEKKLIFIRRIKINNLFFMIENEYLFCPFCGFTYQPEQSKREYEGNDGPMEKEPMFHSQWPTNNFP